MSAQTESRPTASRAAIREGKTSSTASIAALIDLALEKHTAPVEKIYPARRPEPHYNVVVRCPFCSKTHIHGIGDIDPYGDSSEPTTTLWRSPHCAPYRDSERYAGHHYRIDLAAAWKQAST